MNRADKNGIFGNAIKCQSGKGGENHRGFSVIEVMVSLGIFMILLMGVVGLELISVRSNVDGDRLTEATVLGRSFLSTLTALPSTDPSLMNTVAGNDSLTGNPTPLTNIAISVSGYSFPSGRDHPTAGETWNGLDLSANNVAFSENGASVLQAYTLGGIQGYRIFWNISDVYVDPQTGVISTGGSSNAKIIAVFVLWRDSGGRYHRVILTNARSLLGL